MKIAFITDIHEDLASLKETFRKIERINADKIICLGDISGYSVPHYKYLRTRNAHECLAMIKLNCDIIILGNHDIHAAQIVPQNCSFFDYPEDWYNLNYHQRQQLGGHVLWLHEESDLDPLYYKEDIEYLKSLPEYRIIEVSGYKILLSHYVYPNLSGLKREFYTYHDEFRQHFRFMKEQGCKISFTGHAHMKGFFVTGNKKFRQYRYKKKIIKAEIACIGIPPVTSNVKRNGFCIFDSDELTVQALRI